MYTVLIIIHIIVSIFLIAVILLQAGRGGGLADSLGGSQMQSMFGTKSTAVLTKLTTVCAVIFIISCIALAMISSRRSKSLMDNVNMPQAGESVDAQAAGTEEQRPVAIPAVGETQEDNAEAE